MTPEINTAFFEMIEEISKEDSLGEFPDDKSSHNWFYWISGTGSEFCRDSTGISNRVTTHLKGRSVLLLNQIKVPN